MSHVEISAQPSMNSIPLVCTTLISILRTFPFTQTFVFFGSKSSCLAPKTCISENFLPQRLHPFALVKQPEMRFHRFFKGLHGSRMPYLPVLPVQMTTSQLSLPEDINFTICPWNFVLEQTGRRSFWGFHVSLHFLFPFLADVFDECRRTAKTKGRNRMSAFISCFCFAPDVMFNQNFCQQWRWYDVAKFDRMNVSMI